MSYMYIRLIISYVRLSNTFSYVRLRTYDLVSRTYDLVSRTYDLLSRTYNIKHKFIFTWQQYASVHYKLIFYSNINSIHKPWMDIFKEINGNNFQKRLIDFGDVYLLDKIQRNNIFWQDVFVF